MTKRLFAVVPILLLCIGAIPPKQHPLDLNVPDPSNALRLAWFVTMPDETVLDKIRNLEQVTKDANPTAKEWSIYLTPTAALIPIKGWQAVTNSPDTPLPKATLERCLEWISKTAGLRYEVFDSKILINAK